MVRVSAAAAYHRRGALRLGRFGAVAFSVVMVAAMLTACDTTPVTLSGQVTASSTGSNLAGVPVAVFADDTQTQVAGATTNAFGAFEIHESALPSGTYWVRIGGQWWPSGATWQDAAPVAVSAATPAVANMSLTDLATLTGTVQSAGVPLAGLHVMALAPGGAVVGTAVTDSNGVFHLGLLEPAAVTVGMYLTGGPKTVYVGGATPTVFNPGVGDHLHLGTIAFFTGPVGIGVGSNSSCAVRATGTVACWGSNQSGQLGNGTTTDSNVPVDVAGLSGVTAVAVGYWHSCALRVSGTVDCWGYGILGQLGNGTSATSSVPVPVTGLRDATAITASINHTCALRANGTVACWGDNHYGQLGNGTTTNSSVPVTVTGLNDATAVNVGNATSCAVRATGAVVCWGDNDMWQLGDGTTTSSSVPVTATALGDGTATAVSLGPSHVCAVRTAGTVVCRGALAPDPAPTFPPNPPLPPTPPPPAYCKGEMHGLTDATAVTAGALHSYALRTNGTVTCWDIYWGMGYGSYATTDYPVAVAGLTNATMIGSGYKNSCALRTGGSVVCWGSNTYGQLGDGTNTDSTVPVQVTGF